MGHTNFGSEASLSIEADETYNFRKLCSSLMPHIDFDFSEHL